MGEAKRKKQRLAEIIVGKSCVLCGGTVPAETIEHAPPKVFFINKHRPKANEVPACKRCNESSAGSDQIAALVCLTMRDHNKNDIPKDFLNKLLKGVKNNQPDAIKYLSGIEHQAVYPSKHVITPPSGVKVRVDHRLFTEFLDPWAAKQCLALHHTLTNGIVPKDGVAFVHWYTNYSLLNGQFPKGIAAGLDKAGSLRQGKFDTADQFYYKYFYIEEYRATIMMLGMHGSSVVLAAAFEDKSHVPSDHALWKLAAYGVDSTHGIYRLPYSASWN